MDVIDLQLIHGKNKHQISISATASLADLMTQVEECTGVPQSGQKLIHQAKTLTAFPGSTTLVNCNLINGSKVMVLGRKNDPEKDESYQRIVVIDKKVMETAQRFLELSVQVHDIENGHLAKEHQETALRDLEKRCKGCSEQWMRALESLDGIQLQEAQTMAKSKRKSVVNAANSHMDQAEEMLQRINTLKAKV